MKALHAGYVSGAVWKAIQEKQLSLDLDWLDILGHLSHFVIDHDIGGENVLPPELAVLENLLCRGLPTLPSLYIERQLQRLTRATHYGWRGNKGVSAFDCEFTSAITPAFSTLIERAMCVVAPDGRLEPSTGFDAPAFDSQAERDFLEGPLTQLLGPAGMQFIVRQRQIDSMGVENPNRFTEQKTDFSVQFPCANNLPHGIVFEVDGPQHEQTVLGDRARDEALQRVSGWAKTYRRRLWQGAQATTVIDKKQPDIAAILAHPYIRRVKQNISKPLAETDAGQRARMEVLFPFAVARIQRVLLELIRGGILSLDAKVWELVILDRDGLPGCGQTAALDFRLWLRRLWDIYQPGRRVPDIRVHELKQGSAAKSLPPNADVLLDISVQLRYGASLPTPEEVSALEIKKRVTVRSDYWKREPFHRLAFGNPLSLHDESPNLNRHLTFFLRNIFRKAAFRPKQLEIIKRALHNESVIALLPTGAGKSITYQLPALLQNGISIIIDPIKALMKDQDDNLKAIGISVSAFINSMSDAKERKQNTERMQDGCFKFVFVSPERFIIREFRDALTKMGEDKHVFCAYAVVDEAHCVSEWGHDFRTAYLRLGANARKFCPTRVPKLPLLGLTGTASHEVLDDIRVELGYPKDSDISIRPDSMERKNLHYKVVPLASPPEIRHGSSAITVQQIIGDAKLTQLPDLIANITEKINGLSPEAFFSGNNGSGLVFCPHAGWVHGAEDACSAVKNAFQTVSHLIGVYHGGVLDPLVTQNAFKRGQIKLLACTKAFGMGIDKPDIRFTLHYNIPPSLESFYQEAGRAGRDDEASQCWILYSGIPMADGESSLDYTLNHAFHETAFPGAAIEEAKVLELLSENRTPGRSVPKSIAAQLRELTGIDYSVHTHTWANPDGERCQIYINHPDYEKDFKVYINLTLDGHLAPGTKNPYPGHAEATQIATDWLKTNKPTDKSYVDWIFDYEAPTVSAGIEELLARMINTSVKSDPIHLTFDNGYLDEIADKYEGTTTETVVKAFDYCYDAKKFIAKLRKAHVDIPETDVKWIEEVFLKVRLEVHTFRAIYRLTILGAVSDFEADYKHSTITAWLSPQPEGGHREKLKAYVERYAPMKVGHYLEVADNCKHKTELRRCLHALIQFVYDRIAKQRIEALVTMERTTREELENPGAFKDAVTNFFDSKYTPDLLPYLNEYTSDLVFEFCEKTAGGGPEIKHLLGACNRLLQENPDNAAFHALRAYALALLGYRDQDVKDEIIAALAGFGKYHGWGRREKHAFLIKLRTLVAMMSVRGARVFDACIIDDHTQWLRDFNPKSKTKAIDSKQAV
ncbi:MAG: RecQ family ATP-dependent DNA helicase [Elusimicrobiota bacterium]